MQSIGNDSEKPRDRPKRRCAEFLTARSGKNAGKQIAKFRGSSFGGCIHSHLACLRGLEEGEVPAHMQSIFDRGHAAEAWAKEELRKMGVRWVDSACGLENQRDQELTLWGDDERSDRVILLSVTPDGLAHSKDGNGFVSTEMKSFSRDSYKEFLRDGLEGNLRYAYQVSAEVAGYRRKHRGQRITGCIVPIIAENVKGWDGTGERWRFELGDIVKFEEAPFTEEQCLARCREVLRQYDAGEWPDCDSKYACRWPHAAALTSDVETEAIISRYEDSVRNWVAASKELETVLAGVEFVGNRRVWRSQAQMVTLQ